MDKLRKRMPSRGTELWQYEYFWGMRLKRQMRTRLGRVWPTVKRTSAWVTIFCLLISYPGILITFHYLSYLPSISLVFGFLLTLTTLSAYFSWPWLIFLVFVFDLSEPDLFTFCTLFSAWRCWVWAGHLEILQEVKVIYMQLGEFFPYGKSLLPGSHVVTTECIG